jgi:MoxR-like ATPase
VTTIKVKTVKAGRPLVAFLQLCYVADLPPLLVGPHWGGKSEITEQAAGEMDLGYACCVLSTLETTDLTGMPWRDGGVTRYSPPGFLPREGAGLVVLEELNRYDRHVRTPCLQLLTVRKINDYALPPGWLPAACINPYEDGYDAEELDPALVSRFVVVRVEPDQEEWLAWAERRRVRPDVDGQAAPDAKTFHGLRARVKQREVHPDVIRYVGSDAKIFHDTNPRSWVMVSRLVWAAEALKSDPAILEAAVAGVVGDDRALAFRRFRRQGLKPPTALQLLSSYRTWGKQVRAWVRECKTDVLGDLTYSVLMLLQPREGYEGVRNNKKQWKALGDFLGDLPPDLAKQVLDDLRERKREIPTVTRGRS